MKKPELFNRTIGILVNAYMNDTLQHQNCYACAVGNLIAKSNGIDMNKDCEFFIRWDSNDSFHAYWYLMKDGIKNELGDRQIKNTGYYANELNLIELAFERPDARHSIFGGLMNVVDTLIQIHEGNEVEAKEAKELFVNTA